MKPLAIYHFAPCFDGFCSAWIANIKFKGHADFHAAEHYTEPPWDKINKDRDVYVLDYTYPREKMNLMLDRAKSVTVLDHHVTNQEDLEGFPGAVFDMNRSGAGITWDYFFPDTPRPWIVNYVEDRDIWRKALPDTDAIHAYISTLPFEFSAWDAAWLKGNIQKDFETMKMMGNAILLNTKQYIETVKNTAIMIKFEGYLIPCVNAQKPHISELLNELSKNHPFSMGWCLNKDKFDYSLRSDGEVDVSELARRYKGGGHAKSAGFKTNSLISHIEYYIQRPISV